MNVRDSEVIAGLLKVNGYGLTDDLTKAEVVILNTCSVRKHAEDRVFSLVGEYSKRHNQGHPPKSNHRGNIFKRAPIIGIVGCMAKNYGQRIFERAPQVDFAVGPQDMEKIPEIINKLLVDRDKTYFLRKIWETDGNLRPEEIYHTGFYEDKKHAYIIISEGCSNFCSYCIVPFVRGPIRHRNHKDIIREIEQGITLGRTSITLLGQNVNAYKDGSVNFIKLLELVNSLKGLKEVTFMTSHPKDASIGLFKAIAGLDKLNKSLHLPVQSGSDRILGLMNRGYTKKMYLDLVNNYRKIVKAGKLSTDIIVGFPTETGTDFRETYNLFKKIGFNSAFIFKYSPRPNTGAFKMDDSVAKEEKEKRHALMLKLQKSLLAALFLIFIHMGNAYALNIDKVKVYFLSGNYIEAINEGKRIIAGDRYSSELYYFMGLSYLKEGEYQKAADSFKVVINNFKETRFKEEARIGLGDTYLLRGDFSNARNIYIDLLSDNPKSKFRSQIEQRLSQSELKKSVFYSVQVGSFSNIDNARKLTQKLINSAFSAYIEESGPLADRVYRVRVGRLNTIKEAEELAGRLTKLGYPTKICP